MNSSFHQGDILPPNNKALLSLGVSAACLFVLSNGGLCTLRGLAQLSNQAFRCLLAYKCTSMYLYRLVLFQKKL